MSNFSNYFNSLIESGTFFWFCALIGSGIFLIQCLINLFGFTGQDGFDTDIGYDSSDALKFKWVSIQAITGFLMMFGWTALTCRNEFGFQNKTTVGISLAVGLFSSLLIHFILKLAKRLQSTGSVYSIADAIGKDAYVYQSIPKGGVGKISVSLHHFTHEIDAVSYDSEELSSFTLVKIIEKKDDNTVVVAHL